MRLFYHNILKAINDYKNIIKKNFTPAERQALLTKLGIRRLALKNANEAKLYAIGIAIVQELEQHIQLIEKQQSVNYYFGAEEFLQHLKKILNGHVVENGVVINAAQKASGALIKAIQLLSVNQTTLSNDLTEQMYICAKIIAKHGSPEQKKMFYKLITSTNHAHLSLFFRQLQNLIA